MRLLRKEPGARTVLVITRDGAFFERISDVVIPPWEAEAAFDAHAARDRVRDVDVGIVVIDDEAVAESSRGWLIDQIRHDSPDAAIVYVASSHTPQGERAVRAHGVVWYTSKPLDHDRLDRVLRSVFVRLGREIAFRPARAPQPA